jgi:hypothetical protein
LIKGNKAGSYGGGMYNESCKPVVSNCFFVENRGSGGGMFNSSADTALTNCVFWGNEAVGGGPAGLGGGIRNVSSSPVLVNCTFSKNKAGNVGGGMDNGGTQSKPKVTNCIFWGNSDSGEPDETAQIDGGSPIVTYSCIQDGNANDGNNIPFGGEDNNNIDDDPCFADVNDANGLDDIFGTWDDGLRLDLNSPCVDAADGDAAAASDILGFRRADIEGVDNNGVGEPNYVDIGAYEFPRSPAVHFSGGVIAGEYKYRPQGTGAIGWSEAFIEEWFSHVHGPGEYADTAASIPKAIDLNTLDGIAISVGARLVIYSEPNFSGDVVVDETGPAVINNVRWINNTDFNVVMTDYWPEPLQSEFPQDVREWSDTYSEVYMDRDYWEKGSFKIIRAGRE